MQKIAQNIADLVGNTPIIKLNNIDKNLYGNIYAKCEFMNPTSSVKDRIGFNMIEQALLDGKINKNTHIIEPTSGNTGIALAAQCASLGLKLTLTMPDSMSIERRKLISAFGANIVLTPANKGMNGTLQKAEELRQQEKNTIVLQQFENPNNPAIHETTTAPEILKDMDNKIDIFIAAVGTGGTLSGIGKKLKQEIPSLKVIAVEPENSSVISGGTANFHKIDIFIAAVGTGGTLSGIGKKLKQELPSLKVIAVEPENSSVISGGTANFHKIQGIGAGFIPETLDVNIYDDIILISDEDAIQTAKQIALKEGLLVGISSGANISAAIKMASLEENRDKNIVTILCDTGERYLSTELFEN